MQPGLVVVVTETQLLLDVLTHELEGAGWTVLALEDGAELFDFIELMSERPGRRLPQLIIADATSPGPSVLEVCAWARLKGLRMPFIVLADRADEATKDLARALGGVEITDGSDDMLNVAASVAA
ncbi:MAG: hypothetical protein QM817_37525 [Archangium sp.]